MDSYISQIFQRNKRFIQSWLIDSWSRLYSTKQVIECRLIHLQDFTEKQTIFYTVDWLINVRILQKHFIHSSDWWAEEQKNREDWSWRVVPFGWWRLNWRDRNEQRRKRQCLLQALKFLHLRFRRSLWPLILRFWEKKEKLLIWTICCSFFVHLKFSFLIWLVFGFVLPLFEGSFVKWKLQLCLF